MVENKTKEEEKRTGGIKRRSYLQIAGTVAGSSFGSAAVGQSSVRPGTALTTTSSDDCFECGYSIVEDFEDSDLEEYDFDRGASGASIVTSPARNRSHALQLSNENTEMISTSGLVDYPTTGDTFRCWVQATGGADDTNFTYGVQDHDNRYLVRIDFADDEFKLWRHEGGQSYVLASQTSGFSLSEDTWYGIEIEWQDDGTHTASLFDEGQSQLAQISATDTTWSSGGIGFDAYLGSGGTIYYDYLTTWRLVGDVVDDFEDGDLSEYSFDRGSSGASIVSSPVYAGDRALEISNTNTEMISTSGLDHYPAAGEEFGCWIRATGGADDTNFTYGVQDHDNRYLVRIDFADDEFKLWRHEGGQSYVLASQTSGFSLSEDTWYKVKVNWKSDGTQNAELYDDSRALLAEISATDTTWSSGGIGFDAYLGSGGSVYFDHFTIDGSAPHSCDNNDVIDSFEDGDLSEYSFDRGSSGASVVQEPTCGSSKVLEISGTDTELISTSGLDYYPVAGERFSYWVRGTNGADKINLTYGVQDHNNRYFVRVNFAQGHLGLWRYENASATELADKGVSISEDTWYEVEVMWGENGHHKVSLRNEHGKAIAHLSATDLTWSEGGIGYDAYLSDGGTAYFDHVTFNGHHSRATSHIIDSFEDGDLLEYNFDRGKSGASVVSSPTKHGSNALAIDNSNTEMVSVPPLDHYPETGETFSYWVQTTGGAEDMNLTYGVQDHQNRYFIRVDVPNNDLMLFRYENGDFYQLASAHPSLAEDTWYEVEVQWSDDNVHTVTIKDDNGNKLKQISATDSTWTAGGIGYDAYMASSGGTVYVDEVRVQGAGVIDSFEDGDLLEYNFDRGKSGASVVSSPTKHGSNALAISGTNTEMVSVPGLDYHPSAGTTFTYWVQTTGGAEDMNLTYGVQDHQNRYFIRVDVPNNDLMLFRYENGDFYELAAANPSLAEDTWYEVEVYWSNDGTHRVTIYDETSTPLTQITATDSTWTDGGVGYDAYLGSSGGTVYVDDVTFGEAGNLPNDATVTGKEAGVDYKLAATGDVALGIEADSTETTSTGSATGSVDDGETDTFRFSGDVSRVAVTNYVEFVADYSTNTITVNDLRSSPSTAAEYEFSIQGDLSPQSSTESGDTVDDGTATGSVTGDKDEYSFTGDVEKVAFIGKLSVSFQIEYTRRVDHPHPGQTVRDIANHFAEDPNRDRVAFASTTLGDGAGLYLATGATSADDVPDEIIRLYGPTNVGAFDLSWPATDKLEYWRNGGTDTQMLKPDNVNERPIRRENNPAPKSN